jgi:hypothetical protein
VATSQIRCHCMFALVVVPKRAFIQTHLLNVGSSKKSNKIKIRDIEVRFFLVDVLRRHFARKCTKAEMKATTVSMWVNVCTCKLRLSLSIFLCKELEESRDKGKRKCISHRCRQVRI